MSNTLSDSTTATMPNTSSDLWSHLTLSPHFPSLLSTLWHRVSTELTPLYTSANKLITPDIEVAASYLLIDLLSKPQFSDDDVVAACYAQIERSLMLGKPAQCQGMRQLVLTMLMLSPIIPTHQDPAISVRVVELLAPNELLSWDVVNRAFVPALAEPQYD
jgi:hypothetical protein